VRGKNRPGVRSLDGVADTLKGLPLTYNRDLQEDKEAIFDAADTLTGSLRVAAACADRDVDRSAEGAAGGQLHPRPPTSPTIWWARLPFRQAHHVVGASPATPKSQRRKFSELNLEEYRRFSPLFDDAVLNITVESSVAARNVPGGSRPVRWPRHGRRPAAR